MGELNL